MRRRLMLLWTPAVLAIALILPATTAAGSPFTWETLKNTCSNNYGYYGYGKSVLNVRLYEWGKSGAAQFRVRAWAQEKYGGSWHNIYSWSWIYSTFFGNDNSSNYAQHKFVYQWGSDHAYYLSRLKWRGEWLNSSGNTIAYKNLNGQAC
jgi:hypothetical protein